MKLATCLAITLALSGCAAAPRLPQAVDWEQRRVSLQALSDWRMSGRVAVAVDDAGASASLQWSQEGETSDLTLSGPFGAGGLRVSLGPQGLRLQDGQGAWVEGSQAEEVLAGRLGAAVPLAALRYWVLGAPAPGSPFVEIPGADGWPVAFEQAGWQVNVDRWEAGPVGLLPARITARQGGARIRLVVSRWDIQP